MKFEDIEKYFDTAVQGVMSYAPKVLAAILILWVGFKVIKRVIKFIQNLIDKSSLSPELSSFISALVDVLLKGLLILMVAGIVGVDTTSFVALLAAMGFAVGMALQGSLANFASGILILIFKPYKVGDYVDMADKFGKVISIQIFHTVVESPGNKTHVVPNGKVLEDAITNMSTKGSVRLELTVAMPYSESFAKIKKIILAELVKNDLVLKSPEPEVGIINYDSHYIEIAVWPYVDPEDFWEAQFAIYAQIKKAFHENDVKMAYSEGVELGAIGS